MIKKYQWGISALTLSLAACTTVHYPTPTVTPAPVVTPAPEVETPAPVAIHTFEGWKNDFAQRLVQAGHSESAVQRLLSLATYDANVIRLDNRQPEFLKMPWEYATSNSTSGRASIARQKFAEHREFLNDVESRFTVPASILVAIWGIESSFGAGTGNSDLVNALATLAFDGRRREFAEQQLTALLTLLERGDVRWEHMKGSWAGGMGHMQFIPDSWYKYGVDANQNGRINPWETADAMTAAANYLASAGWVRGLSPFYEVSLPANFDYRLSGTKRSFLEWRELGVQYVSSIAPDANATAELWLPAGANGPALLLSKNFEVIRVYNNSSSYALAVSMLAKEIVGLPNIQKAWPTHEQPLSVAQAKTLQQRLTQLGYDTKGVDGVIGTNTSRAFQRWQMDHGQIADGFISQRTATQLLY